MSVAENTILLLIDPQNDFHSGGSLAVAGADEDSIRTAAMIAQNSSKIDEIIVIFDSHHRNHIAHGVVWEDPDGNSPQPFTQITEDDILCKKWTPRDPSLLEHAKFYCRELERKNKFKLMIWPEHCLLGTTGHAIVDTIGKAINDWSHDEIKSVEYIFKGQSCLTEMYSCIEAEVHIPSDPSTQKDEELLSHLMSATNLIVCGQAKSHCVKYTVESLMEYWDPAQLSDIILLTDACSSVSGCEEISKAFEEDFVKRGGTIATTSDVFNVIEKRKKNGWKSV